MKIGFVGLGKMGLNMALNVIDSDWDIVGFDVSQEARDNAMDKNVSVVDSLDSLVQSLDERKILFLSTPAGEITNNLVMELSGKLTKKDIIIDSGNSNFNDSVRNYEFLKEKGIYFIDCGTSGGMDGARNGACLMVGGDEEAVKVVEPFFTDLAIENGYLFAGEAGTGHYLKMVHNGIEYGMMQSIGEGFDVLNSSRFDFDNEKVARVWNHGSVIRSWLMELMEEGFQNDSDLSGIAGKVEASGEGKWMVEEALNLNIPVPIIANSLFVRSASKIDDSFSNKVVATLRHGFGGHAVSENKEK